MHNLFTKAGSPYDSVERPYLPKELQARALQSKLLPFRISMSFCAEAGIFVPLRCLIDATIVVEDQHACTLPACVHTLPNTLASSEYRSYVVYRTTLADTAFDVPSALVPGR